MRILVTGGGGFIGQGLVQSMAARGHDVVATYRSHKPERLAEDTNVACVQLDLADGLGAVPPVDAVIHAAAHTHLVPDSTADDYIRSNVQGTRNLVAWARKSGVRYLINLSTLSVYGELPAGELTEETPLYRPGLYGATKYLCELTVAEAAKDFGSVSIRLPGVVAPGYFTPWIGQVLRRALAGEEIVVYNADAPFNNIVDVEELGRFIAHALKTPSAGSEMINLAASDPLPIGELVGTIVAEAGSASRVSSGDARKPSFSIVTERVKRIFAFHPASTREMVRRYVRGCVEPTGP